MNYCTQFASNDRQFVVALARGLAILSCFRVDRPHLTNGELAECTGLPRSSVSRLTHTLIKIGYLEYDSRQVGYRLSAKVLSLGYAMLGGMDLRPLILPHMKELAEKANGQVALATCEDFSMLIVEVAIAKETPGIPLEVGSHAAMSSTAMGRAYFASCSAAEQKKIREHFAKRNKRNAEQVSTDLSKASATYRDLGYCISINDWQQGVNGVAIPLYLKNFGRRMVLTCGGPAKQLTTRRISSTIAPLLIKSGSQIERAFERLIGH